MPAILVRLSDAEKASVEAVAKGAGMKLAPFCRKALMDACACADLPADAMTMLRQIHKAVCTRPAPAAAPEVDAARAALVTLGLTEAQAARKLARLPQVGKTADELVLEAMKDANGN